MVFWWGRSLDTNLGFKENVQNGYSAKISVSFVCKWGQVTRTHSDWDTQWPKHQRPKHGDRKTSNHCELQGAIFFIDEIVREKLRLLKCTQLNMIFFSSLVASASFRKRRCWKRLWRTKQKWNETSLCSQRYGIFGIFFPSVAAAVRRQTCSESLWTSSKSFGDPVGTTARTFSASSLVCTYLQNSTMHTTQHVRLFCVQWWCTLILHHPIQLTHTSVVTSQNFDQIMVLRNRLQLFACVFVHLLSSKLASLFSFAPANWT